MENNKVVYRTLNDIYTLVLTCIYNITVTQNLQYLDSNIYAIRYPNSLSNIYFNILNSGPRTSLDPEPIRHAYLLYNPSQTIHCFPSACRRRTLYHVTSSYTRKEIHVLVFSEDNNNTTHVNIELYPWFDFEKKKLTYTSY